MRRRREHDRDSTPTASASRSSSARKDVAGPRTRARAADRADDAQHGPVAPGDARHRAHRARRSTARRSSRPTSRSATCTAASRRCPSARRGRRCSRTPTASTTSRRCSTTSATRWRSRSCWASPSEIPERAQYIRVIVGELSRITDHLTCIGAMRDGARRVHAVPLRAQGARVALRPARGGLRRAADATATCASAAWRTTCPTDFADELHATCLDASRGRARRGRASCSTATASSSTAWTASASITQDDAIAYGCDRPDRCARRGVAYDVRKDHPYSVYDRSTSTCRSARTATTTTASSCASRRCTQSMRILDQALEQIPDGPVMIDDPRVVAAAEERRSTTRSRR